MNEHEYPMAFVLLAYTLLVNQASHGLCFPCLTLHDVKVSCTLHVFFRATVKL